MSDQPSLGNSYFLSYSRDDESLAMRFAHDLRERGIAMWVDQLDIRPSERWDRAIERAVRECRGLVVILSPRSVASDNVADEISFAIDSGKSVLPIMIERCTLPLRITRMQVINATGSYDRALEQCVCELQRAAGAPASPAEPAPTPKGIADPEILATAKARLTGVVGPIAGILVDKAARRACSAKELYELLTEHIENESDRERFRKLAGTGAPKPAEAAAPAAKVEPSPIGAAEIARAGSVLTQYLGPIATVVARREGARAASPDELQQRLAALIPNEAERADFLRQVR